MTDQNTPMPGEPIEPQAGHTPPQESSPWGQSVPPVEHTRPLPPFEQPAPPAPAKVKRGTGLAAGVLAGALVLGGAAGVGGAAWYDAWQGTDTTTSSSSGPIVPSGSNSNASTGRPTDVESVAAKVLPSVVKINVTSSGEAGSGSGIVLDKEGHILTNNHVVSLGSDEKITVNFNDGSTVKATVVGTDPVTDLAVIKVPESGDLVPATIGKSADLRVGQGVVAVGSPFGLNATVTSGIVSALNRPVSVPKATTPEPQQESPFGFGFGEQQPQQQQSQGQDTSTTYPAIQTDAAINPGNSGGALVNLSGQVVGINSSIRTSGAGDSGSIGLGFAIPIDQALPIVTQLIAGEKPTHARLAITVSDVTGDALAHGAVVQSVQEDGPADKAGLQKGDIITKVDDDVIDGSESLVATIRGHRPEDSVTLTFVRDGKTQTVKAALGSDAESDQS